MTWAVVVRRGTVGKKEYQVKFVYVDGKERTHIVTGTGEEFICEVVLKVDNHPTFISAYSVTSDVGVVRDVVLLFFGAFVKVGLGKCEEEGVSAFTVRC